jgi:hypothetical protein
MPSYLVETYLPRGRATCDTQARLAAEALTRGKTVIRFDHSIHVPEDEVCLYVFDAASADDAAQAASRAGLDAIRVVEAIPSRKEKQ